MDSEFAHKSQSPACLLPPLLLPAPSHHLLTLHEVPDVALLPREADHGAVWGQTSWLSGILQSLPTNLQDEPKILDAEEGGDPVVMGEEGVLGQTSFLAHGQDVLLHSLWKECHQHLAQGHFCSHLHQHPEPPQPQPDLGPCHLGPAGVASETARQAGCSQETLGGVEQRYRVGAVNPGQGEGARPAGICLVINNMNSSKPGAQGSVLTRVTADSLP